MLLHTRAVIQFHKSIIFRNSDFLFALYEEIRLSPQLYSDELDAVF